MTGPGYPRLIEREGDDLIVGANFVLAESRELGFETWAGRVTYRLRLPDGHLTQLLNPSADRWRDA